MTRAYLGIGSNLGDRWGHLRACVGGLRRTTGVSVAAVSGVYESDPVGGPEGQPPYLNAVVEIETNLEPRALLGACHTLEAEEGRERTARWGPRTLDVDILLFGQLQADAAGGSKGGEGDPVIPHPRMWERSFVVLPLAELAPGIVAQHMGERLPEGVPGAVCAGDALADPPTTGVLAGRARHVGSLEEDERHPQ